MDDDAEIRELLGILLTNADYEVGGAECADDAVEALRREGDFSLIVLDVMMPRKDGFQACAEIREFCNLPILFLTAKEYEILLLLCKTKGKVFSAQNIYESVWGESWYETTNNTIMVHVRKIREKIEKNPQKPEFLKTVWGMGYKIET